MNKVTFIAEIHTLSALMKRVFVPSLSNL